jgi:hypothetical protein
VGKASIDLPRFYLPLVVSGDHARASPSGLQPGAPAARPAGAQTTRQISLSVGWNLISFNVLRPTSDVATVLASIAGLYSVVLGYDRGGLSYYRPFRIAPVDPIGVGPTGGHSRSVVRSAASSNPQVTA